LPSCRKAQCSAEPFPAPPYWLFPRSQSRLNLPAARRCSIVFVHRRHLFSIRPPFPLVLSFVSRDTRLPSLPAAAERSDHPLRRHLVRTPGSETAMQG